MTNVLRDLQAEYDARAKMALEPPGKPLESIARPKATRTYTGAELERRRAWGKMWGTMNAEHARKLRNGEVG